MRSRDQSTPPPWDEGDSFRETTLIYVNDPEGLAALRRVGRLIYDLAVETTTGPANGSPTRVELGAAAVELRFMEGYLASVGRQAVESDLEPEDDALAHFAGRLAGQVASLAEAIEKELR